MPISLLRRTPSRPTPQPDVVPTLGVHLPDMTMPLIDAAAWASMPRSMHPHQRPQSHSPGQTHAPQPNVPQRNSYRPTVPTTPESNSNSSHSPASPSSIIDSYSAGPRTPRGRAPSLVRDSHGNPLTSFHRPFSSQDVTPIQTLPNARRGKARRHPPLTILVAGPSGAGKTSFIEALISIMDDNAQSQEHRGGQTTCVVRHEASAPGDRRSFVFLDTPGLPKAEVPARRERALAALTGIVEQRLSHQLSEENKVVRRKSDGAELVHLIIYVLDARSVLCGSKAVDIDWEAITEPPAKSPRPESRLEPNIDIEAKLAVEDIEAIRRFAVRANVLPVLTHADALTTNELEAVRGAVIRDLAAVFGRDPLGAWGILTLGQDMEVDEDEDEKNVPFAVFSPEPGTGFTRSFRWGRADAADAAHSDLPDVRDAIIAAADWLRTSTREVVYERYRTERLLSARNRGQM